MSSKNVKLSVEIEIEANVDAKTDAEAIEFMLERLTAMTIRSIDDTEQRDWDCVFHSLKLVSPKPHYLDEHPQTPIRGYEEE